MKTLLPCFAGLLLGSAVSLHAETVSLAYVDFETAGQVTGNFRVANTNFATFGQTSNGAANDFMTVSGTASATVVYDANGAAAGVSTFNVSQSHPLTVSADVSFPANTTSFGIYIINNADPTQAYLALFNLDSGNDRIRFSSNATPNNSGAGSLSTGTVPDAGFTFGTLTNISLTYSINASNNPVLTMTAGSQSNSIAFTAINTPFTDVQVGFRITSNAGTVGIDNLSISTIPEPSTFAVVAGVVAVGAVATRRRIAR